MPKTWCIHMSNPILIYGNIYVSKPLYISFEVAEFWGVFTLGSPIPHILSCFFCSFSPVSISNNRNLSWSAVKSAVHTFCVLLLQEEEMLSCGIPRAEATRKAPLGCSHSYLPASILGSASDILVHIRLCVLRLGFGSQLSQYTQSSESRHFPLISVWNMFNELTSLPVMGSCHSVYITLFQQLSGCERPHLISSCCHCGFSVIVLYLD